MFFSRTTACGLDSAHAFLLANTHPRNYRQPVSLYTRNEWWACPPRSGSTPRKPETVTGCWLSDLRPSEVVHETIPDPAEQVPLVARSVTPPSPSGRGGTTLLRQRAPRSCTVFVMTPPNEHTSGGRARRSRGPVRVPRGIDPIQCTVLKCSRPLARTWSSIRSFYLIDNTPKC